MSQPTMEELRRREAAEARKDADRLLFLLQPHTGALETLDALAKAILDTPHPLTTLRETIDAWREELAEEAA